MAISTSLSVVRKAKSAWRRLEAKLAAKRSTTFPGGPMSFAIPFDPGKEKIYFQLDIKSSSPTLFDWKCMLQSYGDLWHILGTCATRFGFCINDRGFHVCVKEIEETNKRDSLCLLTRDIEKMMAILHLDKGKWEKGFETLDELFCWVGSSRFFRRGFFVKEEVSEKEKKGREKRGMYGCCVEEWLPIHTHLLNLPINVSSNRISDLVKDEVLEDALETFDKWTDCGKLIKQYRIRLIRDGVWRRVATGLPLEGKDLGSLIQTVKKRVIWGEGMVKVKNGRGDVMGRWTGGEEECAGGLVEWVLDNWERVVQEAEIRSVPRICCS